MGSVGCVELPPGGASETFGMDRAGDVFTVEASAVIAARPDQIWGVLTDYNHVSEFVPGIASSRIVEEAQPVPPAPGVRELVVDQKGALGLALFPLEFAIRLHVSEHPLDRIDVERISGSARQYRATYRIELTDPQRTRLDFHAVIESDRFVPPLLGTSLMRSSLSHQFDALVREIERRVASPLPAAGGARE